MDSLYGKAPLMKIAFKTLGCRANAVEIEALREQATRHGFVVVGETDKADAYVVNTCTVTSSADRDVRYHAKRCKRINPSARVALVGCFSQVSKIECLGIREVDYVFGTSDKFQVLNVLADDLTRAIVAPHFHEVVGARTNTGIRRDWVRAPEGFLPHVFLGTRNARAAIKIQDGCNYHCSYCIIPAARGRSRSLSPENVCEQVTAAQDQGFSEVILTGIHLAS
jgi:threonylcarbamoyladenosine tRNA methylthiotransferase MtaB